MTMSDLADLIAGWLVAIFMLGSFTVTVGLSVIAVIWIAHKVFP
jgi:hypothetical protein